MKPTPPELVDFSYSFGAEEEDPDAKKIEDADDHVDGQLVSGLLVQWAVMIFFRLCPANTSTG